MIEFNCEHCNTDISVAPDQIGEEIFCPACEQEVKLPELDPMTESKIAIAKAQAKGAAKENWDKDKAKKMLEEPDSQETKVWKERLAQSFQATSFKQVQTDKEEVTLKPPEEKEEERKKSGIRKIFDIFPKK